MPEIDRIMAGQNHETIILYYDSVLPSFCQTLSVKIMAIRGKPSGKHGPDAVKGVLFFGPGI